MSKRKPVIVTITKTRRKSQPFTFSIDLPGSAGKQTKAEYYTRSFTCKMGALRQLGAVKVGNAWECAVKGKATPIEFVSINKAKK